MKCICCGKEFEAGNDIAVYHKAVNLKTGYIVNIIGTQVVRKVKATLTIEDYGRKEER